MNFEEVLTARRTFEHCAINSPADIAAIAKEEFFRKLKIYIDEREDQKQLKLWELSEAKRAEQLTLFNSSGPNNVAKGAGDPLPEGSVNKRIERANI